MGCWKQISLVLIIGCLAVYATSERLSDARLLLKPYFLQAPTTTRKPTTIIVKPSYPYPYYPNYYYPSYRPPYRPPRPTYHPTKRPKPPVSYPYHPSYPYYPPAVPPPPYGYYPYGRPPYVVVVRPPGGGDPNGEEPEAPGGDDGMPEDPEEPEEPEDPEDPEEPEDPENPEEPQDPEGPPDPEDNQDPPEEDEPERYFLRSPVYTQSKKVVQPKEFSSKTTGRKVKLNGITLKANSAKVSDTIKVDTKNINLPFNIEITSNQRSNKKANEQEALIYLRNYKNGRKLKVAEKKA